MTCESVKRQIFISSFKTRTKLTLIKKQHMYFFFLTKKNIHITVAVIIHIIVYRSVCV